MTCHITWNTDNNFMKFDAGMLFEIEHKLSGSVHVVKIRGPACCKGHRVEPIRY